MGKYEPVTITAKGICFGEEMTVVWKRDEDGNTDVTFNGEHNRLLPKRAESDKEPFWMVLETDSSLLERFERLLKRRYKCVYWFAEELNTAGNVCGMLKNAWFDHVNGNIPKIEVEGKLEPGPKYEYDPNAIY